MLLLETTNDYLPIRLIKSLLPGSWLGEETPKIVNVDGWDTLLRKTGFSGVDTNSSPAFASVILSQAVDSTVNFLRDPLSGTTQALPHTGQIVLIRSPACSTSVTRLESQTRELLIAATQTQITSVIGLEGIQVPPGSTVLLLWDLDVPIFDQMDEERFFNLQEVSNASVLIECNIYVDFILQLLDCSHRRLHSMGNFRRHDWENPPRCHGSRFRSLRSSRVS